MASLILKCSKRWISHALRRISKNFSAEIKFNCRDYNFKTGMSEAGDVIQLKDGQPLILEGIHGMNPRLISDRWAGAAFRVYVSALTQLNLDRHNRVSTTDTRLIRRIVRDARERGYSATQTISGWESVRRGEKRHIFPYQENADVMFNSALVYELAALKPLAEPLLRQVQHRAPEYHRSPKTACLPRMVPAAGCEFDPRKFHHARIFRRLKFEGFQNLARVEKQG